MAYLMTINCGYGETETLRLQDLYWSDFNNSFFIRKLMNVSREDFECRSILHVAWEIYEFELFKILGSTVYTDPCRSFMPSNFNIQFNCLACSQFSSYSNKFDISG